MFLHTISFICQQPLIKFQLDYIQLLEEDILLPLRILPFLLN